MNQRTLYVDDFGHYMDADYRSGPFRFEDLDAALTHARRVVDQFLLDATGPEMSAAALFESFRMFGPDPWIVPGEGDPNIPFSAWNYSQQRCQELCGPR
ncbi:hypothetical protein AWB79_05753 [Caballeronia hypogeia]|uniref:Uncharacterized protein n=1 Tax=Caballeronia hypogeia TaxID=1777140 RepID=A0A158CPP7_9BURK|nr:hypothetical protein [Caballeronia hypogeia]SAK84313.1 hypothetical protein AWB79_05753 [Caballeronia hypogeia]